MGNLRRPAKTRSCVCSSQLSLVSSKLWHDSAGIRCMFPVSAAFLSLKCSWQSNTNLKPRALQSVRWSITLTPLHCTKVRHRNAYASYWCNAASNLFLKKFCKIFSKNKIADSNQSFTRDVRFYASGKKTLTVTADDFRLGVAHAQKCKDKLARSRRVTWSDDEKQLFQQGMVGVFLHLLPATVLSVDPPPRLCVPTQRIRPRLSIVQTVIFG